MTAGLAALRALAVGTTALFFYVLPWADPSSVPVLSVGGSSVPIGPLHGGDWVSQEIVSNDLVSVRRADLLLATYQQVVTRTVLVTLSQRNRVIGKTLQTMTLNDNALASATFAPAVQVEPGEPIAVMLELPGPQVDPPVAWWAGRKQQYAAATLGPGVQSTAPVTASLRVFGDLAPPRWLARAIRMNMAPASASLIVMTSIVLLLSGALRRRAARLLGTAVERRGKLAIGTLGTGVVASTGLILILGHDLTFSGDEWAFILDRDGSDISVFLRPHNGHPVLVPVILYKFLLGIFGLRSYVPYIGALALAHSAVAVLLYFVLRRRCDGAIALAGALVVLFLGSAWEDLLSAVQIAFVSSVLFGLVALLLLEGRPSPLTSGLAGAAMLLSVASSGLGLFFIVAAALEIALDRPRRGAIWSPLAALFALLAWIAAEKTSFAEAGQSLEFERLAALPSYVAVGLASTARAVLGLGPAFGPPLLVAGAIGAILLVVRSGSVSSRAVGLVAALVLQFTAIGLVRGNLGEEFAGSPRYLYSGVVFAILLGGELLAGLRPRMVSRWLLAILTIAALSANSAQLVAASRPLMERATALKAELRAIELLRDAPDMNGDAQPDALIPNVTPRKYLAVVDTYGSPALPADLATLYDAPASIRAAVDEAIWNLFASAFQRRDMPAAIAGTLPDRHQSVTLPLALPGNCSALSGRTELLVPSRSTLHLVTVQPSEFRVFVAFVGDFQARPTFTVLTGPNQDSTLAVADLGAGRAWRIAVEPPPSAAGPLMCLEKGQS